MLPAMPLQRHWLHGHLKALVLLLLAGCARLAHGCTTTVRFGMTLTFDLETEEGYTFWTENQPPDGFSCYYCHQVVNSIRLWQVAVNNGNFVDFAGCQLLINVTMQDDGGTAKGVQKAYEDFADQGFDFFISPSIPEFTIVAGLVAQNTSKLMFTWSAMPALTWRRSRGGELEQAGLSEAFEELPRDQAANVTGRLLWELMPIFGTTCPYCDIPAVLEELKETPPGSQPGTRRLGSLLESLVSSSNTSCSEGGCKLEEADDVGFSKRSLQEDDEAVLIEPWDYFYQLGFNDYTLDVNTPPGIAPVDCLLRAYSAGARSYAFLTFTGSYYSMCEDASTMFSSLAPEAQSVFHTVSFQTVIADISVATQGDPQVIMLCGEYQGITSVILTMKALSVESQLLIIAEPQGKDAVIRLQGYNIQGLVEPLPVPPPVLNRSDSVFGSYGTFVTAYTNALREEPGIASLQIAAIGSLVVQALVNVDVSAVNAYLRQNTVDTLLGPYVFDSLGKRSVVAGGKLLSGVTASRQASAYPSTFLQGRDRYEEAQVQVISDEGFKSCPANDPDCIYQYRVLLFPVLPWFEREVLVYPCAPGCFIHNRECEACPPGTYRTSEDLSCRPCLPGSYAEVQGLSECRVCRIGARCSEPSQEPEAVAGRYKVTAPGSVSQNSSISRTDCVPPRTLTNYSFLTCHPRSVCLGESDTRSNSTCLGENTGMMCGRCPAGWTYHTWKISKRECEECPSMESSIILLLVGFVLWRCLIVYMHRIASAASAEPFLPVAVMRLSVNYFFLLAAALENTTLDAELPSVLMIPFNFLYRPLDLFAVGCAFGEENAGTDFHVQWTWQASALFFPVGIAAIIAVHIFWFLAMSLFRVARRCWRSMCRPGDEHRNRMFQPSSDGNAGSATAGESVEAVTYRDRTPWRQDEPSLPQALRSKVLKDMRIRQMQYLSRRIRTITGECNILAMLSYAIAVRGLASAQACHNIGGGLGDRLVLDWDIVCDSKKHEDLTQGSLILLWLYLLGVPLLAYMICVRLRQGIWNVWTRYTSVYLYEGLKPHATIWEVVAILKLGLFIWFGRGSSINQRCVYMLVVLVAALSLYLMVTPYEPRDRQALHNLERLYTIGVMGVIVVGFVIHSNHADEDKDESQRGTQTQVGFSGAVTTIIIVVVCVFNGFAVFYGLMVVYIHTISLQLQALIEDGASVGSWSYKFHKIIQRFRGINKVSYFEENGAFFIDVSELNEHERSFLVLSLTQTIHACMDSSNKFHTWLVEKALHEAFTRAAQGRAANIRALYNQYGQRPWSLTMNNCLGRWIGPVVTLRPPDIPSEAKDGNDLPNRRQNVTVEELHNALTSVDIDVLERHPGVCQPIQPKVTSNSATAKPAKESEVVTWNRHQPLKVFEEDMEQHGALIMKQELHPSKLNKKFAENDILQVMMNETEEHHAEEKAKDEEFEHQLAELQEQIEKLKEELREKDPDALEELEKIYEPEMDETSPPPSPPLSPSAGLMPPPDSHRMLSRNSEATMGGMYTAGSHPPVNSIDSGPTPFMLASQATQVSMGTDNGDTPQPHRQRLGHPHQHHHHHHHHHQY